jgi:hypothetical protein
LMNIADEVVQRLETLAPKRTHRAAHDAAHWAWRKAALQLIGESGARASEAVADIASSITVRFEPAQQN